MDPNDLEPYKRTPEFDEQTVPAGLLRTHDTKEGVWARVRVLEGSVRLAFEDQDESYELTADEPGVIAPRRPHHLELLGPVRFYVEFCKAI